MLTIEACENGFIVKQLEVEESEFKAVRVWVATDPPSLGEVIKTAVKHPTEACGPMPWPPLGPRPLREFQRVARRDEHGDGPHAA